MEVESVVFLERGRQRFTGKGSMEEGALFLKSQPADKKGQELAAPMRGSFVKNITFAFLSNSVNCLT